MAKHKSTIRYNENKAAKVGTELICPVCGEKFTKRQWMQAFCCGQCKDKFWNRKGDRHRAGYYEEYDLKHPERIRRRILYGATQVVSVGGALTCAAQREILEHRADLESRLDQYTDEELKEMYINRSFGSEESSHIFDIDGQMAECEF